MLSFPKTVTLKPTVIDKNGSEIKDLTVGSLKGTEFYMTDLVMVSDDFAMRPDLICELHMGGVEKLEIFLKANEISNPFAIDAGELYVIPDPIKSSDQFAIKSETTNAANVIRKQYVDAGKASITNNGDTLEDFVNREKTKLPPNYSKTGDKEMIFANGQIILGPHVTKSTEVAEIPLDKQKYLTKIKELMISQNR